VERGAQRDPTADPEATVQRLPVYLRALVDLAERDSHTVSSEALATAAGVNSAKIRKDFLYLGSYGTRGVGYDVEYLIHEISRELGLTQDWATCIVGPVTSEACAEVGLRVDVEADPHDLDGLVAAVRRALA
jgi:redox-sensing transcriptional repressor